MPKISTKAVIKALTNASSSRGSYVPQKLKTFLDKTKISSNFGSQRIKDALKKSDIDQKRLTEIFKKAKEEGVLRQTSSTGSEREFYKAAAKEEKSDRQLEQKNQKNTNTNAKESSIAQARKKTDAGDRWREAMFGDKAIRGMERIHAGGEEFRKQQAATAGVLKSRGGGRMAAEKKSGSLVDHAVKEGEKSDSSSKSGQKGGGSASAGQKSGSSQPVKLQGSAGIDQLTHPQEFAKGENLPGGVYHVEGLDEAPVSQPEAPPVQKSSPTPASASEDITDLDIG